MLKKRNANNLLNRLLAFTVVVPLGLELINTIDSKLNSNLFVKHCITTLSENAKSNEVKINKDSYHLFRVKFGEHI